MAGTRTPSCGGLLRELWDSWLLSTAVDLFEDEARSLPPFSLQEQRGVLSSGFEFGFEGFEVEDGYAAAFDGNQALGLQAAEVAGDQLADSAELGGEFLVVDGQLELDALRGLFASAGGFAQEKRDQAVADGAEGQFFDDAYQAAQAASNHAENFEGDLRVV